uniref:AAA+ ATPase domain-containing protein n=1 Tax=viral metagenome TaxID=1070528 RepID=A0A6C0IS19_9ZZZZ
MEFSKEQQNALSKYTQGKNIFLTGPGGTGKSALIRHIYNDAHKKGIELQVCALIGCAAVLLECKAKTIHSWASIGLANGPSQTIVNRVIKNRYAKQVWKDTDVLIIDEVSMMSQKIFELLDSIGKAIRKSSRPFGGIQLIFSGDFYQLPPVGNKEDPETMRFCFESPLWFETFRMEDHVQLVKIFRQNDPIYQRILNQLREGRLKRSSNELLLQNVGKEMTGQDGILMKPTKLFPTKNKVEYINSEEMIKLTGEEYQFKVKYHADLTMTEKERLIRLQYTKEQIQAELLYLQGNLPCDALVKLKVGAQVMCIVNIPLSNGNIICNGAQGIITSINENGIPVVRYRNGYQMAMEYHMWESEFIPGIGISQVPLILAWALTIHKAQGSTLDIAEVDAGSGIFECGQTYVALSRVKSIGGLYLASFDAKRVRINKKVQGFYEKLDEYDKLRNEPTVYMVEREIELMPEAYAEEIPIAIAVPIEEFNLDQFRMPET